MSDHNTLDDLRILVSESVSRCGFGLDCDSIATVRAADLSHLCDECAARLPVGKRGRDFPNADRIRRLIRSGVLL